MRKLGHAIRFSPRCQDRDKPHILAQAARSGAKAPDHAFRRRFKPRFVPASEVAEDARGDASGALDDAAAAPSWPPVPGPLAFMRRCGAESALESALCAGDGRRRPRADGSMRAEVLELPPKLGGQALAVLRGLVFLQEVACDGRAGKVITIGAEQLDALYENRTCSDAAYGIQGDLDVRGGHGVLGALRHDVE